MRAGSVISYILELVFIGIGFHKLYVYKNPESAYLYHVNAYVGADAYNYIINAGQANAYFTLACFCAIIATTFVVSEILLKSSKVQQSINIEEKMKTYNSAYETSAH